MAKLHLPPGWPDPYDLLRDLEWEQNYPMILLRGIYSIMEKQRRSEEKSKATLKKNRAESKADAQSRGKQMPGDVERRYLAGFNITVFRLVKADQPRFFPAVVKKGHLSKDALTSIGKEREAEVMGRRDLSPKSLRRYGKGKTRTEMEKDTVARMKHLRRLLLTVRHTTAEEGMPPTGGGA
jgi:hypothetical protein